MEKNQIESNPFYTFKSSNNELSRIMKFSEHFFTYYIRFPLEKKSKEIDVSRNRIDFVFSENYDEIFIGIVKANKTSYENTFQYEMNLIDKFMVNKKQANGIDLLVVLKNNSKAQYICSIKNILKINADGLVYLLNEKLNLKNENTNSNNNFNNNNNGITPY